MHTLWAWCLLALSHQQAGSLGVRRAISWVVWTHYHPNEWGSATREITLEKSGKEEYDHNLTWANFGLTSPVCSLYLELVLCVYVPHGRIGVEGGMWMVPAHHAEAQGGEHITGLSLRNWVHLTLQACAHAVAWLSCTDLHSDKLAQNRNFTKLFEIISKCLSSSTSFMQLTSTVTFRTFSSSLKVPPSRPMTSPRDTWACWQSHLIKSF